MQALVLPQYSDALRWGVLPAPAPDTPGRDIDHYGRSASAVTARTLGSITATDLGIPVKAGKVSGTLSSVRHFVIEGQPVTVLIVKVPARGRSDADHREISGASADLVDA